VQLLGVILSFGTFALGAVLAIRLLHLGVRMRTAPELAMGGRFNRSMQHLLFHPDG